MNKKILIISLMVVSMLVMALPFAFANVDVNISGTGSNDIDTSILYDDDAIAIFNYTGYGSFNLRGLGTDNTGHPYMGVDSTTTTLTSDIVGGGFIQFEVQRLDSYGGYGLPGQTSYSYVSSNDVASLDFRTTTNYADLYSSNHGFQANQQFYASGSYFEIEHTLTTGSGEGGSLVLIGDGVASVDYMTDGYTDYNAFQFGSGCGCYENADLTATGSGLLTIGGYADNTMSAHDGSWSGVTSHLEQWAWSNGGTIVVDDYAFSGN